MKKGGSCRNSLLLTLADSTDIFILVITFSDTTQASLPATLPYWPTVTHPTIGQINCPSAYFDSEIAIGAITSLLAHVWLEIQ
jgi:hypothetical protein